MALPAAAQDAPAPESVQPAQAPPPQASPRFPINAFQIVGNRWLTNEVMDTAVYPFMGPDRTPDDVEAARAALQAAYEQAGYATVTVYVPEQGVETGTIRLQVEPQAIARTEVTGARNPDAIRAAAPSLAPGAVPNVRDIQREIVALNRRADLRVTPELTAGEAPGTIDVALRVEERSAFHGTIEVNNYNSTSTTDTRVAASLRHDNLFGNGESLSLSAQTAPERTDDGTVFSANFLSRIGNWQVLAYGVHSDSNIATIGGTTVVGQGDIVGLRVIAPLPSGSDRFFHSLTFGLEGKRFGETVTLGADQQGTPIRYMPASVQWRGDWLGETVHGDATLGLTMGIPGVGTRDGISTDLLPIPGGGVVAGGCVTDITFECKRVGSRQNFFYLRGDGGVTFLRNGWELEARLSGQYTSEPLISNEQFSLGGMETVRGYFESEVLGDYGLTYSLEARTPWLFGDGENRGLRLISFVDLGFAGLNDPPLGFTDPTTWRLGSAGLGLRLRLFRYLHGSFDFGVPLRSGPDTDRGDVFAKFRIWGEF